MYNKKINYFELLIEDRNMILNAMIANKDADIQAGYNPYGANIAKQLVNISDFKYSMQKEIEKIGMMDPKKANWYCYTTLVKNGAITA